MRVFEGYQKGVNLGGWLSQCNAETKEYFDTFITEADIEKIAGWGMDHVRVPVDYIYIEDEDANPIEQGYEYLDKCVGWCRKYGLNMLIDLHKTYGYSFDPLDKDMDREAFFHNEKLQQRFIDLWKRIADRYKDDLDMLAFELLNEIVSPNVAEEWNVIADRTVAEIRKIAPKAYIVIGGVCYNNVTSVPLLHKPYDDHVVYNFHCYEPMLFSHQSAYWVEGMPLDFHVDYPGDLAEYREKCHALSDALVGAIETPGLTSIGPDMFDVLFRPAVETAIKNDAPLYCGEYGIIDQAPVESAIRWFRDIHSIFEKYNIGRAVWNYKEKDFGIVGDHYDSIREELLKNL